MSVRAHKGEIRELLESYDTEPLLQWAGSVRNPRRTLFSLTYDASELIRWRATEAIGSVCALEAVSKPEKIRDFVRRLLWLMNDESGGLGWRSPEMIGEVLVNAPDMIKEFGPLLPAFLVEEPFETGAHIAVYRVARIGSTPFVECDSQLMISLGDNLPIIRGYAALALAEIGVRDAADNMRALCDDQAEVRHYDFEVHDMASTTVGNMAETALGILNSNERAA